MITELSTNNIDKQEILINL